MAITLNGTTGITNDGGYTGDGVVFADTTPSNTLVTTTGGNVGIAVSSPAAKLDVLGDIFARASTLRFKDSGNTTQYGAIYADSTTFNINGGVDNLIMYSAGTERMRITSAGNVLINSTSGTLPLSVQGINGGAAAGMFTGASAGVGNDLIYFYSSGQGALLGYIGYNGSVVTYNTTSDYRLKDNIEPMIGALEKISALKPVTYTWKLNNANGHGFIAHELAEVFPDAVSGEKDGIFEDGKIRPQGIDTSILVATLTAAIQEQQAIITDLKSRIEALEAK